MTRLRAGAVRGLILGMLASVSPALAGESPPLEKLLELNGRALFGGTVKAQKGRMTVTFEKSEFERGFTTSSRRGRFIFESGRIVSSRNKAWAKGAEKGMAMVGIGDGLAVSRFELEGNFEIRFRLKIPEVSPRSVFSVRLNQRSANEYIQTNFFTDIRLIDAEGRKRAAKAEGRYARPVKWFDTNAEAGVLFTIRLKDGELTLLTGQKTDDKKKDGEKKQDKIVSLGDIESPAAGRLSFMFANTEFVLIRDLEIEGDLPRSWAEKEVERLRRAGSLRTKEEASPEAELAKASDKGGEAGSAKDREVEVDIDADDPEIDEDL